MEYNDKLYGLWEIPDFIGSLIVAPEFQRLNGISQSVLPSDMIVLGNIPSRLTHSLGVCRLSQEIISNNPMQKRLADRFSIAALLHDTGNPPLSHLSEPFLEAITGLNGESFLREMLKGTQSEKVIKDCGFSVEEIIGLVTGNEKPFSDILHGSMDIDNLDNVGRFNVMVKVGAEEFDALRIVRSFRFRNNRWVLPQDCFEEAMKWKRTRAAVYQAIYSFPHLSLSCMIWRAVQLAFERNELKRNFFFLTDRQAVDYLKNYCNERTAYLAMEADEGRWYEEVFSLETTNPSEKLKSLCGKGWRGQGRIEVLNLLCSRLGLSEEFVCVYCGKGRDVRKITVPFIDENEAEHFDELENLPVYRLKIFVSPLVSSRKEQIIHLILQEII